MTMKKLFYTLLALVASYAGLNAQSMYWAVLPEYDKVTQISEDTFAAVKDGRMVVLKDGKVKTSIPEKWGTPTMMTPFHEGRSLVLQMDESTTPVRYRLLGVVDEDFQKAAVPDDRNRYYVDLFPFFSSHRLPVYILDKGEVVYGYMKDDAKSNELTLDAMNFDYSIVTPYDNGAAWVQKKGGRFSFKGIVRDAGTLLSKDVLDGDWILVNTSGRTSKSKASSANSAEDIINAQKSMQSIPEFCREKAKAWKKQKSQDVFPDKSGANYGYKVKNGRWLLPAQLDHAEEVYAGYALVTFGDKQGVLKYDEQNINILKPEVTQKGGGQEHVKLAVHVPSAFTGDLRVEVNQVRMEKKEVDQDEGLWHFEADVQAGAKQYALYTDNKLLLKSDSAAAEGKAKIQVSGGRSLKANAEDKASTSLTVTNLSSETITLQFSGARCYVNKKEAVLAPNEKVRLSVSFSNVQSKTTGTVTVKGARIDTQTVSIQVEPFI